MRRKTKLFEFGQFLIVYGSTCTSLVMNRPVFLNKKMLTLDGRHKMDEARIEFGGKVTKFIIFSFLPCQMLLQDCIRYHLSDSGVLIQVHVLKYNFIIPHPILYNLYEDFNRCKALGLLIAKVKSTSLPLIYFRQICALHKLPSRLESVEAQLFVWRRIRSDHRNFRHALHFLHHL